MIFIDGGHLRAVLEPTGLGLTDVDFNGLAEKLTQASAQGRIWGELIRVFYYDANVAPEDDPQEYGKRDAQFEAIRNCDHFQLRLGRLIKTPGGYRQKGVDALLATDMITKAYDGQYEIAVLVAGDDDFLDVVNVVKDKGRRVYGAFEQKSASKPLVEAFDKRISLELHDIPRIKASP